MPERVQLRRSAGWRLPENTVKVDRTTRWGNPFVIGEPHPLTGAPIDRDEAFALYRQAMSEPEGALARQLRPGCDAAAAKAALAGRNLACWCRPDQLCHGDFLLKLVN